MSDTENNKENPLVDDYDECLAALCVAVASEECSEGVAAQILGIDRIEFREALHDRYRAKAFALMEKNQQERVARLKKEHPDAFARYEARQIKET